jgi:nucleotide-binding universal stress UspA family protein
LINRQRACTFKLRYAANSQGTGENSAGFKNFYFIAMTNSFELKKLMVCLDLSEMDEPLIRFAAYIARMMDSDRIYFTHIAESLDMPAEIRSKYPDLFAPVDETIEKQLEHSIKDFFQGPENISIEIEVREGSPSDKILKIATQKDVDLLVLGKKIGLPGEGVLANKLTKVANRSVLLVPEILPKLMDRILVPVDFSRHSLLALKQAIKIKETNDVPMQITCQHVYHLPSGWHTTGKSETEFAEIMEGHAEKDYREFLKQLDEAYQDTPCTYTLDNNSNIAHKIYQQALKYQADIIILGSRGKTAAASVLMGSTAERLADYDKNIPLLIVKDKNENIGFLKALFSI